MSQWTITVQGTGADHNVRNVPHLAMVFVRALRDAGHHIVSTTLTQGARQDIVDLVDLATRKSVPPGDDCV